MKRPAFYLFFVLVSLCFSSVVWAAAPLRVEGRNCTVDDKGSTTWYGFFKGKREVFAPLKGGDKATSFTKWRCFEAEEQCASWTYWMQTDFPEGGNEAFCRQGG